jgi:enolase-phosphatase E1
MHILFSVYEDVPKALESWTNDGRKIYVYSSGSVEAQELLFEHSIHGNLLKVLRCHRLKRYTRWTLYTL